MTVIVFDERPRSRRSTNDPPAHYRQYVSAGIFDSGVVKSTALLFTPALVATTEAILYRKDIECVEEGAGNYTVNVGYHPKDRITGTYTFRGSTTGGTLHIRHSKETIEAYPTTIDQDRFNRAIDVEGPENRPRGTDIVVPAAKASYTFKHPLGVVNESQLVGLARLTGRTNSAPWHGFAIGEALYLGADMSDGTEAEGEITHHVVFEENLSGLVIGSITGIAKKGHEFLWVWWEDHIDAGDNQQAVKPRAVFIERLHDSFDFATGLGF